MADSADMIKARRAQDALQKKFTAKIEKLGVHMAVGLLPYKDRQCGILVRCQSKNKISMSRKNKIQGILGDVFEFERTRYQITIEFGGIAVAGM